MAEGFDAAGILRAHLARHPVDSSVLTRAIQNGSLGQRIRRRRRIRAMQIGSGVAAVGFASAVVLLSILPGPTGSNPSVPPALKGQGEVIGEDMIRCGAKVTTLTPASVEVAIHAQPGDHDSAEAYVRVDLTLENVTAQRIAGLIPAEPPLIVTKDGVVVAFPRGSRSAGRGVDLAAGKTDVVSGTMSLDYCSRPYPAQSSGQGKGDMVSEPRSPLAPGTYQVFAVTGIPGATGGVPGAAQAFGGPWTLTVT